MSTEPATDEPSKFDKLLEEQLTPRTQYGLVVLFVIGVIYGITSLTSYNAEKSAQAENIQAELEIWSDENAQDEWRARAQASSEVLTNWEAAAWQAPSPGVAAAEIEIEISRLSQQANVPSPRIEVRADTAQSRDSNFLRFDVSGNVPIESVPHLLVLFAANQRHLIVTDVQLVTRNQSTSNFQISGVAPFKRAETGGTQ